MASASSKLDTLTVMARLFLPALVGTAGYAAWRVNWQQAVRAFVAGPGRTSRIALLLFVIFNWKNMPFAWTYRVFYAIIYHNVLRKSPELGPRALYRPMITPTHAPMLETDYNLHKSNSTYFSDLDISRTHLVSYLCRPALKKLSQNAQTKMITDPTSGKTAQGGMSIILGSVSCSFRREIASYKGYELWSRVLCWDRKWMYIITHFVPKGTARPTEWLDPRFAKTRTRKPGDKADPEAWHKKIYATAVSKYVFKIGRLTVHPADILVHSGLLPERPDGWKTGPNQVGDEATEVGDVDLSAEGEWDWRRVEAQRRSGMERVAGLQEVDDMTSLFDGGSNGALAMCGPG